MDNVSQPINVSKCSDCGRLSIAPRYVCAACGSELFVGEKIDGTGSIYSHTTIRVAPEKFMDQVPYPMAIVELAEGLRLTARILPEDGPHMKVGTKVVCVRKDDKGYWFEVDKEKDINRKQSA